MRKADHMADIGQMPSKLAFLTRVSALAGAALALAACQTPGYDANGEPTTGSLSKPNFPIQAETPPPPAPVAPPAAPPPATVATTAPPPVSTSTAPVESKALPPPPS